MNDDDLFTDENKADIAREYAITGGRDHLGDKMMETLARDFMVKPASRDELYKAIQYLARDSRKQIKQLEARIAALEGRPAEQPKGKDHG